MTFDVVFEDPPAGAANRSHNKGDRLVPVRQRPGAWARVYTGSYESARSTASRLRRRPDLEPGQWEFVAARFEPEGVAAGGVWARFIPAGGEAPC